MYSPVPESDVSAELRKMIQFVRQEALEKAREIQLKANEEFQIEKAKITRQEMTDIERYFDERHKEIVAKEKIALSARANSCRLALMRKKSEFAAAIETAAIERVKHRLEADAEISKDFVLRLLLESAEMLALDGDVRKQEEKAANATKTESMHQKSIIRVQCAAKQASAIGRLLDEAAGLWRETHPKHHVTFVLDDRPFGEDEWNAGVVCSNEDSTISVKNTVQARLEHAAQAHMPLLQQMLRLNSD